MATLNLAGLVAAFPDAEIEETPFGPMARVPRERYKAFCEALQEAGCLLSSVTAVDRIETIEVVAHILESATGQEQITIKVALPPDDPRVDSLTPVWAGAEWQERETYDMYGVIFEGHPDPTRVLLVDDFEGFPLRKSFELEEVEW